MMGAVLLGLVALAAIVWFSILLLPWQPWRIRHTLEAEKGESAALDDVTVLIPARNEAPLVEATLQALRAQGSGLRIYLIDDASTDGTAERVARLASRIPGLKLLPAATLPEGWTGKLWALQQGLDAVRTPWVLLLDADIELTPGILPAAVEKCRRESIGFLSLMAQLRMVGFWERLLLPSFVFFFKLLYPFALSNRGNRWVAAAAGGFVLCKRQDLLRMGGFHALRGAVIDDCTLARHMRRLDVRTWIGLSHAVRSQRRASRLQDIWHMVARTAFAQLQHSLALLLLASGLLLAAFLGPLAAMTWSTGTLRWLAVAAWLTMLFVYQPTLAYYHRSGAWALLLPLIGTLYLAMTWTSAVRYWRGVATEWKDRRYSRTMP